MGRFLLLAAVLSIPLSISDARAQEFHGIPCGGGDCSHHEAGYRWAQEREITREAQCERSPQEFHEGCVAWAREYRSGFERARNDDVRDASECDGTDAENSGCEDYVEER
jgi:hypothetical protein